MEAIFKTAITNSIQSTMIDVQEEHHKLVQSICDTSAHELSKTHYLIQKEECSICLDDILPTNQACAPCGHKFCFTCILRAFYEANVCPYCRKELVDLPEDDEEDEDYEEAEEEDDRTVDSNGWETVSDSEESDDEEEGPHESSNIKEAMESKLFAMEDYDAGWIESEARVN
jgi:Ring finger domain